MDSSNASQSLGKGQTNGKDRSAIDIHNPDPQVVDIVSRHLVNSPNNLQLQGGDITRDLYKWSNEQQQLPSHPQLGTSPQLSQHKDDLHGSLGQRRRSLSFSGMSAHSSSTHNEPHGEVPGTRMTHEEIRAPGGFRRSFILQQHERKYGTTAPPPNFFARNFIEFLTLYGHFAGQDLEEDEDEEEEDEEQEAVLRNQDEESVLLERVSTRDSRRKQRKATTFKAVLLLLKSFVGTGVLFLPRAFHNGGWAFSTVCLLFCALASSLCFILLISAKGKVGVNGYGDLGKALYGDKMRFMILFSIALSQVGFSAAYTVFTATNLKVFSENALAVPVDSVPLSAYIVLQALIFIPLSLTRNIAKLSGTALVADLFILLGLLYVYYYPAFLIAKHGVSDTVLLFNRTDWSLFIGTAIFTFEGIGLLIPIQESMKHPQHFYPSLAFVMCIVTLIFISSGLLCYCAFGAKVETVVLLNFPQDNIATMSVQLIYSLAILLSTPLQLFPAIRIFETWTFPLNASGKHNKRVKWLKNYFRTGIVILTALLAWIGANDLDKFVSFVGSFACIPLIYVYPPLLHLKVFGIGGSKLIVLGDALILVFGMGIMAYTSYQNIVLWGQ
ncbi:AVT3 (YKL146W) [Zygosaccharomyces parabailii]|nr:AVT3 (YKL146W) [Zygosaccharomyces parabailii]CDH10585.1 related to AVT3-Protein involved in amino acid efflux from the vacuole [Zygosaccharomyces bailii ISA1307]